MDDLDFMVAYKSFLNYMNDKFYSDDLDEQAKILLEKKFCSEDGFMGDVESE